MKKLAATALTMSLATGPALAEDKRYTLAAPSVTLEQVRSVSPALEKYTTETVLDNLWKRPGLSPRDRSVITLAALIARNQPIEMPFHVNLALDNGVKPAEISEIITHLAFYSGWANAMAAVAVTGDVFAARGIGADQLPEATPAPIVYDKTAAAADAQRAAGVEQNVGPVSPGVVEFTNGVLFKDLWLRPGLTPRDRSLITVTSLISSGQVAQVTYHLGRAIDAGLTQAETSEMLTHLEFYAGWPNVFSAVPIVKDVFDKRKS
ncbi:4-carboxymuconolactone decarboxylase [Rhizobium sp. PP-F2F-G20b]|nr:4-carboxymuconolactone decarboxylase [Rhizobium sp. PP-F2F-G20b]TCQ03519.1 4-carboxymuconolactone decarboxylase [Rhizobium sp. PP-F2F-G36]